MVNVRIVNDQMIEDEIAKDEILEDEVDINLKIVKPTINKLMYFSMSPRVLLLKKCFLFHVKSYVSRTYANKKQNKTKKKKKKKKKHIPINANTRLKSDFLNHQRILGET